MNRKRQRERDGEKRLQNTSSIDVKERERDRKRERERERYMYIIKHLFLKGIKSISLLCNTRYNINLHVISNAGNLRTI